MTMTGKERAELRAHCNQLRPTVHVGAEGLSQTLTEALDDALRTRELVKVQLNRTSELTAKAAARELAGRVKAEIIQTIGKTATFYRKNPQLKRKPGVLPWKE